jgi:mannosylglucosylglycerate synthase
MGEMVLGAQRFSWSAVRATCCSRRPDVRALHLATRLHGTDGVSLEARKVADALEGFGFASFVCAGEVDRRDPNAVLVGEMHFEDAVARELGARAFSGTTPDPTLEEAIDVRAAELAASIGAVVDAVQPDLLVIQNAWAIPMQLPLARALADVARRTQLPCLSHEHDYHWERERFASTRIPEFLDTYFPFDAPNVRHLCINGPARDELARRRGVQAALLPNVFDFHADAPGIDAFNQDFRDAIGMTRDQRLFLQPTRVVPRKGIELAIDLLAELSDARDVLVATHRAGDEGVAYLRTLERYAAERDVDFRYVAERIDETRGERAGTKVYALWDAYPHADFVTYPSLYEGFGNALLETIHFRKPALVNRYAVYVADIAPKGFRFVEIEGAVTARAVRQVAELLDDPARQQPMTDHNHDVARRHYALDALRDPLATALRDLGFRVAPGGDGP